MGVTPKIPPVLLTHLGLLQRAKEGLLSVLTTDSENPFSLAFLGQMALYRWDYDEAEEYHLRISARFTSIQPTSGPTFSIPLRFIEDS